METALSLKSLVLCSDQKIVRVLRRTLGDLEIGVELCADAESALRKLTRHRFEAIIVDCAGPGAADVLRSARIALCNKRAVAVAIVDAGVGLRAMFDLGAHFVLYKPVSSERAKSSFRAARALMKRERRRNLRIPVQISVAVTSLESGAHLKVTTTDFSEGGLAVSIPRRTRPTGRCQVTFTLPGTDNALDLIAEIAWAGSGEQAGLRFVDISPQSNQQLQDWLRRNTPETEKDDPPLPCKLTDLTLGGCYLEVSSPFPVSTHLTISMRVPGVEIRAEGIVRVMHPEKGMGVEFTQTTSGHRTALEKFLGVLSQNRDVLPELLVEPDGLELAPQSNTASNPESTDDPLLELFRKQATLPADSFQEELRKRRGMAAAASA